MENFLLYAGDERWWNWSTARAVRGRCDSVLSVNQWGREKGTKRCILSPERLSPFALALSGKERGYP
jgi:hypothetical protein